MRPNTYNTNGLSGHTVHPDHLGVIENMGSGHGGEAADAPTTNGASGKNAETFSGGGGGGGGHGATRVGSGKPSKAGGGGGGGGMSWLLTNPASTGSTYSLLQDDLWPSTPLNTAMLIIPLRTEITALAPTTVSSTMPDVRITLEATRRQPQRPTPLQGTATVYQLDSEGNRIDAGIAVPINNGRGELIVGSNLPVGTYHYEATFAPELTTQDTNGFHGATSEQITIESVDTSLPPQLYPEGHPTITAAEAKTVAYGEPVTLRAKVWPETPAALPDGCTIAAMKGGSLVAFLLDGTFVGEGQIDEEGWAQLPLSTRQGYLSVGTHPLVAYFYGDDLSPDCQFAGSNNAAKQAHITVVAPAEQATVTTIDSPSSVKFGDTATATATVTAEPDAGTPTGRVLLLADGHPIDHANLTDGSVTFTGVKVPFGTTTLTAAYLGDQYGNFNPSSSAEHAIEVTPLATTLSLVVNDADKTAYAGEMVSVDVTLSAEASELGLDPEGNIELLLDGKVESVIASGDRPFDEVSDGLVSFSTELQMETIGEHQLSARFVPGTGFTESFTDSELFEVLPRESTLSVVDNDLTIEEGDTAFFDVNASVTTPTGLTPSPFTGTIEVLVDGTLHGTAIEIGDAESPETESVSTQVPVTGLAPGTYSIEFKFTHDSPWVAPATTTAMLTVTPATDPTDPTNPTNPDVSTNPTPVANDQLTDATRHGVTATPNVLQAGESFSLNAGSSNAGTKVLVWIHSTPQLVLTGTLNTNGSVNVTTPSTLELGQHRVVLQAIDGSLIGWTEITITEKATPSRLGTLPVTGADAMVGWSVLALMLLLAGTTVTIIARRRKEEV